ncbi:MAG: methyltransferase [Bacteroides sp.]|nr:methyltransferase [Bacteroides sp.]
MEAVINGISLTLYAHDSMFSPNAPDKGTLAMLTLTEISRGDKVLDLGCGSGIVGIYAAKLIGSENVVMTDSSEIAAEFAKKNAALNNVPDIPVRCGNGYENITDRDFTVIMSNPPYHTDFSVAKAFIEGGYRRLAFGGRMIMVTKRLDWYKNKLSSVFGGVNVREKDGYYIFTAEKRQLAVNPKPKEKARLSKKLRRKYSSADRLLRQR